MAANNTVPDKNPGDLHFAAEVDQIAEFQRIPMQTVGSAFNDSGFTIDGTAGYTTLVNIAGATHTITAAGGGHSIGNAIQARYSFAQDCTLTLVNFDLTGSNPGTINPIPAGIYDIWFMSTVFGAQVHIPLNGGGTPTPTLLTLSNFTIETANPDRVLFDASGTWAGTTFAGFTLADPTKTITGFTNNGTSGSYFTVSVAYVVGDTAPTIDYAGSDDWSGTTQGDLALFGATAVTNNLTAALTISNFTIDDANKDRVNFDSNQEITVATTFAGFTLADPTKTISSIFINGSNTTGHYFVVSAAYVIGDSAPTLAYDGLDDWTAAGGDLAAFGATAISNLIAPTFTVAPESSMIDDDTFEILATTDVVGKLYAVAVADAAAAPTSAEVKAGTGSGGSGEIQARSDTGDAQGDKTVFTLGFDTGFSSGTAYDVYVVAETSAAALQATPTKVDLTTGSTNLKLDIVWQNGSAAAVIVGNTLTSSTGPAPAWEAFANATLSLAASTDGYVVYDVVAAGSNSQVIGFDTVGTANDFNNYEFGVQVQFNGNYYEITSGVGSDTSIPWLDSDLVRLSRVKGDVLVQKSSDSGESWRGIFNFGADASKFFVPGNVQNLNMNGIVNAVGFNLS